MTHFYRSIKFNTVIGNCVSEIFFHLYLEWNTFIYSFLLILVTIAIEYISGNWELVSWKRRSLGMISRERIYVFSRAIMLHEMVLQFSPRIIFPFWNSLGASHWYLLYRVYLYFSVKPYTLHVSILRESWSAFHFSSYSIIDWFLSLQFCFFDFYTV